MDIHKPKPWHGFREFLKEYLIIVVGVLTALGGEQGVEWLHWRHLAHLAEHDLAAGLKADLFNSVNWLARDPCNTARIGQLSEALRTSSTNWRGTPQTLIDNTGGGRQRVTPIVLMTPNPLWTHEPWERAVASDVLNHMPRDRVANYGVGYRVVDLVRGWQFQAVMESQKLGALAFDGPMGPSDRAGYLNALAEVETLQSTVQTNVRFLFVQANAVGIGLTQAEVDERVSILRKRYGDCVAAVKLPIR